MQYVGFFMIGVALIAILIGIVQQRKAKKILAAPFRKTGEIAQNAHVANVQGMVSCEGNVMVYQPLMAPCSGKPCVYYEVELVRHWEKAVNTENGLKTERGTSSIATHKQGSSFQLNDGSGPVNVDARQELQAELEKSFEQMQHVTYGDVMFGQFRAHVPYDGGERRTTGVKAVEKILPAQGPLFVMGKLVAGAIAKTDGMMGKLLVSTKGRDTLVGGTRRNALIGFIAGGVMLAAGAPMSILGEPPKNACQHLVDQPDQVCVSHLSNDAGTRFDWTVTQAGTYAVEVIQPPVKNPIWPVLTIQDASGALVAESERTQSAKVTRSYVPGKYTLTVRDSAKGYVQTLKGGFSFSLKITRTGDAEAAGAAAAPPSSATSGSVAEGASSAAPSAVAPPVAPPPAAVHPLAHPAAVHPVAHPAKPTPVKGTKK